MRLSDFRSFLLILVCAFSLISLSFAQTYQEAPDIAQRVSAGELPPVTERLPENPIVVEPVEQIGSYGGEWRMGLIGAETPFVRIMAYENLVRWNPEWTEVIPNVAESFEVSEDATTYTFKLREGMKWSDGAPFTSDDIVFWYEDVLLNEELNPAQTRAYLGRTLESVKKQDDTTVVFTFAEPNGVFLAARHPLRCSADPLYPSHYAEGFHTLF